MSQTMEESEGGQCQQVTYDECFDLLSNHRRRYTLHYLQQNGGEASLGDLSERVAAWENEIPMEELSYDERKRVYTSLQQVHLPRMDDAGVVVFDDREGRVEVGPAAEELDIYLEIVEDRDVPWSAFYLGLAVLNALVVGAAALGVPGVGAVPDYGLAVFVVTTFFVASVAHLYLTRTEMRLGEGDAPPELQE
jgi:hypothetical protein